MRTSSLCILSSALIFVACGSTVDVDVIGGEESSVATSSVAAISSTSSSAGFTLKEGSPEGTVHVKGYAETEIVVEPFCDDDFCPEYEYVFFVVVDSDSQEFTNFLSQNGGNAFGADNRIGLGCEDDNQIVYENDSDTYGRKEFVLSDDISEEILDSSPEHLVALTLTKLPLSGGAGAPACYAHFTTVELWDEE